MAQDVYTIINSPSSVPLNQGLNGTVSTHGTAITGVNTHFLTDMPAGSYLVDLNAFECKRVVRVDSDTVAYLEEPFTSNLSSVSDCPYIPRWKAGPVEIYIDTMGPQGAPGTTISINGANFRGTLTRSKAGRDRSGRRDLLAPIVIDPFNNDVQVNILY